jgi:hypothetical protein
LFEQAGVTLLLSNDGRNLSFALGALLADTLEGLGLARTADLPDPLRRVRLVPHGGTPSLGIVLRPQGPEMLILTHPRQRFDGRRGDGARLDLPGKNRLVEIPVRLTDIEERDQVRLLHIARPDGWGTLGRAHDRFPVLLPMTMLDKSLNGEETAWIDGEVFDLGEGGVCACLPRRFPVGRRARIQVNLEDPLEATVEPFFADARVVWARPEGPGRWRHGFAFEVVEERDLEKVRGFLSALNRPIERSVYRPAGGN